MICKRAISLPPWLKQITAFLILLFFLYLAALFLFNLIFYLRIMPGITINQFSLSGMTKNEAYGFINRLATQKQKEKLTFAYQNKRWQASLEDLGISYDVFQTVQTAYLKGRENFLRPLLFPLQGLLKPINLQPFYHWNQEPYKKWQESLKKELEIKVVQSTIELANQELLFKEGKPGQEIDFSDLEANLIKRAAHFDNAPITIKLVIKTPALTAENAQPILEAAKKLTAKKIALTFQEKRWDIDKKTLLSFIDFSSPPMLDHFKQNDTDNPTSQSKSGEKEILALALDEEKMANFINRIGKELDRPPQDAKLTVQDGKVKVFLPAFNGLSLNRQEVQDTLKKHLMSNEEGEINILLPVFQKPPKIQTQDVNNIGIKEMLGTGSSNFAGSQKERIDNIELAASKINGTLIAPGEIFSFNQTVGEISEKTGYKTAYIIERGRTIFGTGGGVCQVSTTLFRAAIFSGLPVVERYPHAYRVHYYEKAGHPPGLDATIYIPDRDLKFKNDTKNHILIVSKMDRQTNTLTFELWGTSDGRKTQVSKPIIKNLKPPPPPLYEEDPTLAKGIVKQADFAAWGADVSITRKVTRGEEVLINENIFSHYKAWQAIFKVGTKEP